MDSKEEKNLYLITKDQGLREIFHGLGDEFFIISDSNGKRLKKLGGTPDSPVIDLVVSDYDFFIEIANSFFSKKEALTLPYFMVMITPEQASRCAFSDFEVKCFPVFLPVNDLQIRTLVRILIQNREKVLALGELEKYRILFHKAPVGQLLVNPCDLLILDINSAAAKLFGKNSSHPLIGRPLLELYPENSEIILEKCKEAYKNGESNFQYSFVNADGTRLELAFFVSRIELGKQKFLFLNIQDITETKKTEKKLTQKNLELIKTNSELDNFVYSTSHELRAPLMSVLGLISLLEGEASASEQALYIDLMKESIQKLDYIIQDIIDYSRNARFEVEVSLIDFNHLFEKTLDNLRYIADFDRIDLRFSFENEAEFISDKRRVEIILNNLLSNSLKFHNPDATKPFISLDIHTTAGQVIICLEDNGKGIPAEHLSKIFDMFFRGYEQSTGSGIGLYIVREIIEKLNGSIRVDSQEGEGTTFTVMLPNQPQDL